MANSNNGSRMTPEAALQLVLEKFPFKDYIKPTGNVHISVASAVARHLAPGSKILDFGSGPCDKTAMFQAMGYECYAYDDLQDSWHVKGSNQAKIMEFAKDAGIRFTLAHVGEAFPYPKEYFDMVTLNGVVEHLHDSPRDLLNDILELLKPGGLLLVTVPNAANIRKRLDLLRGRTNYQRFDMFYWYPGQWRGHVREYVKRDLASLSQFLGLEIRELSGEDQMLRALKGPVRFVYLRVTSLMKSWKDTWLLVARKPEGWKPRKTMPPGTVISSGSTKYLYGE